MEKNKNILNEALQYLPDYTPDDNVWNGISSNLNKKTASLKIAQLSSIEPPQNIWDNIDKELSRWEKRSALRRYDPPESVWENIEQNLSKKKTNPTRRRRIQLVVWSSAAAAILLLGFFIFTTNNTKNKNFIYSEEMIELHDVQEWNDDEQIIEQALNLICKEKPTACSSPEFKMLEEDLAFLNKSKEAILLQLSKYNTNTELEIMLTEIELERTSLIKEMIAKTI